MHETDDHFLNTLLSLWRTATEHHPFDLRPIDWERIQRSATTLQHIVATTSEPIYGVNTGFGALCNTRIEKDALQELQVNLLRSHAAGVGEPLPDYLVRLILLLKIINFSYGYSGVRPEIVKRLLFFYEHDILPYIPAEGSLGASGDLAPLAHMALTLIGEGKVKFRGRWQPTAQVYQQLGLAPLQLAPKEGLALINGTQVSTALAIDGLAQVYQFWTRYHWIALLSLRAFQANWHHFHPYLDDATFHPWRRRSSRLLRTYWGHYEPPAEVQDPYSFRCIPHVAGAAGDALAFAARILYQELFTVSDNPLLINKQVLSGGHFHAEPITYALQGLRQALERLSQMSERRQNHLLQGKRGLPAFLALRPGLESGLMIAHYTTTYLTAKAGLQAHSLTGAQAYTSAGQEDHVSYAPLLGLQLQQQFHTAYQILAIEALTALRALALSQRTHSLHPWLRGFAHHIQGLFPQLSRQEISPAPLIPSIQQAITEYYPVALPYPMNVPPLPQYT